MEWRKTFCICSVIAAYFFIILFLLSMPYVKQLNPSDRKLFSYAFLTTGIPINILIFASAYFLIVDAIGRKEFSDVNKARWIFYLIIFHIIAIPIYILLYFRRTTSKEDGAGPESRN